MGHGAIVSSLKCARAKDSRPCEVELIFSSHAQRTGQSRDSPDMSRDSQTTNPESLQMQGFRKFSYILISDFPIYSFLTLQTQ